MKIIRTLLKTLGPCAIATLVIGCAANLQSKQELAISSDFRVITPTKPDQKEILAKLPPDKLSKITYDGKTYYVLPDKANKQAYVGGPKQYENYQQLAKAKGAALEADTDESIHKHNEKGWSGWDGWGGWDRNENTTTERAAADGWY